MSKKNDDMLQFQNLADEYKDQAKEAVVSASLSETTASDSANSTVKLTSQLNPEPKKRGRPTKTQTPKGDRLVKTGFMIPETYYELLKEITWREKKSMNTGACEALAMYLEVKKEEHGLE